MSTRVHAVVVLLLSLFGGMKLAYLSPGLEVDQRSLATSIWWRLLLIAVGVLEVCLTVGISYERTRIHALQWSVRILCMFGAVQVVTDLLVGHSPVDCGCLGPGVSIGPTYRLLITGALILLAAYSLRSAAASAQWRADGALQGPGS